MKWYVGKAQLHATTFLDKVTRIEIIGKGREYTKWDTKIALMSLQDDSRTLKIFLKKQGGDT